MVTHRLICCCSVFHGSWKLSAVEVRKLSNKCTFVIWIRFTTSIYFRTISQTPLFCFGTGGAEKSLSWHVLTLVSLSVALVISPKSRPTRLAHTWATRSSGGRCWAIWMGWATKRPSRSSASQGVFEQPQEPCVKRKQTVFDPTLSWKYASSVLYNKHAINASHHYQERKESTCLLVAHRFLRIKDSTLIIDLVWLSN